ncbi:pro-melanin-concentrating hormone, like [Salarias fasciatus]|uniref:pro-melanin-concentrating hormone, like n=1 Tax=Salarias fasciatus TaxID=181472 RepID=UPI00117694E8|nr:pro-MCH-like [Salarias fasciatus]
MRQSLTSLVFAAALLFQCYALSVALPTGKSDGDSLEQEAFASLLGDEATENSFGDVDLAAAANAANARGPRMIVVAADPSLWRELRMLRGGPSFHKRRADDSSPAAEHRDVEQGFPILRRDTMRCMVGRVYRPCWEV